MYKKNLMKLLPAVAVIIAIAAAGFQQDSEVKSTKTVQAAENELIKSDELTSLLTTAYFNDGGMKDTDEADSSILKTKKSKSKIKKAGITTGKTKALPEKSAAASGQGQGTTTTPTTSVPKGGYKDGIYQGSGTGFGGTITVQVTVTDHKIAAINIVDASNETASYFANAQGVISKILASQSPNVDAVSGATYSSNGIITAVQNALSQAIPSGNQAVVTPTPTPSPKPTKKPSPIPKPGDEQIYKDGTYTGTGKGYSGTITLTAKIKKGVIKSLEAEHTDTPMFFKKAWDILENEIIQNQSVDGIDTVSGATLSSEGILGAAQKALAQAKK